MFKTSDIIDWGSYGIQASSSKLVKLDVEAFEDIVLQLCKKLHSQEEMVLNPPWLNGILLRIEELESNYENTKQKTKLILNDSSQFHILSSVQQKDNLEFFENKTSDNNNIATFSMFQDLCSHLSSIISDIEHYKSKQIEAKLQTDATLSSIRLELERIRREIQIRPCLSDVESLRKSIDSELSEVNKLLMNRQTNLEQVMDFKINNEVQRQSEWKSNLEKGMSTSIKKIQDKLEKSFHEYIVMIQEGTMTSNTVNKDIVACQESIEHLKNTIHEQQKEISTIYKENDVHQTSLVSSQLHATETRSRVDHLSHLLEEFQHLYDTKITNSQSSLEGRLENLESRMDNHGLKGETYECLKMKVESCMTKIQDHNSQLASHQDTLSSILSIMSADGDKDKLFQSQSTQMNAIQQEISLLERKVDPFIDNFQEKQSRLEENLLRLETQFQRKDQECREECKRQNQKLSVHVEEQFGQLNVTCKQHDNSMAGLGQLIEKTEMQLFHLDTTSSQLKVQVNELKENLQTCSTELTFQKENFKILEDHTIREGQKRVLIDQETKFQSNRNGEELKSLQIAFESYKRSSVSTLENLNFAIENLMNADQLATIEEKLHKQCIDLAELCIKYQQHHGTQCGGTLTKEMQIELASLSQKTSNLFETLIGIDQLRDVLSGGERNPLMEKERWRYIEDFLTKVRVQVETFNPSLNKFSIDTRNTFEAKLRLCLETSMSLMRKKERMKKNEEKKKSEEKHLLDPLIFQGCEGMEKDKLNSCSRNKSIEPFSTTPQKIIRMKSDDENLTNGFGLEEKYIYRGGFKLPKTSQSRRCGLVGVDENNMSETDERPQTAPSPEIRKLHLSQDFSKKKLPDIVET